MAVEGTLDVFQLPEILQVIAHQRKTGILTVQGQNDIIAVSFLSGQVVAADALNQTMEDGLGDVLAHEKLMTQEQFADIAGRHREGGGPLNDLLVSGGHITRPQLLASLRTQIIQLLSQLLAWREGEFKFYGGDEVSYEDGFRPISVEEVLLNSLRKRDEQIALPTDRTRFRRLEPSKPINIRPMESPGQGSPDDGRAQEDPRFLWINPAERAVLDHVNASRTVDEVAEAAGIDSDQARYLLFQLEEMALVESLGEASSSRPREVASAAATVGQLDDSQRAIGAPVGATEPSLGEAVQPQSEAWSEVEDEPATEPTSDFDFTGPTADYEVDAPPRPSRRRWRGLPNLDMPIAWLTALALAVGTVWALASAPLSFLFPGAWLDPQHDALVEQLNTSRMLKIDRAAKTHYLIHESFPQDLQRLVDLGLLAPTETADVNGIGLELTPADLSYLVDVADSAGTTSTTGPLVAEAVTDNFLLDPSFAPPLETEQGPPLVLLD